MPETLQEAAARYDRQYGHESWFKWRPTDKQKLREAEMQIIRYEPLDELPEWAEPFLSNQGLDIPAS